MRVRLGEVSELSESGSVTRPFYGVGPWWRCAWWQICGFFYGCYWTVERQLETEARARGEFYDAE